MDSLRRARTECIDPVGATCRRRDAHTHTQPPLPLLPTPRDIRPRTVGRRPIRFRPPINFDLKKKKGQPNKKKKTRRPVRYWMAALMEFAGDSIKKCGVFFSFVFFSYCWQRIVQGFSFDSTWSLRGGNGNVPLVIGRSTDQPIRGCLYVEDESSGRRRCETIRSHENDAWLATHRLVANRNRLDKKGATPIMRSKLVVGLIVCQWAGSQSKTTGAVPTKTNWQFQLVSFCFSAPPAAILFSALVSLRGSSFQSFGLVTGRTGLLPNGRANGYWRTCRFFSAPGLVAAANGRGAASCGR